MISALVAAAAVLVVVPLSIPVAIRLGAVARLGRDRWSRRSVTTLGGLGLSAGMIAGTLVAPLGQVDRFAIVAGIVVLLILGLRDDLAIVSPRARLVVQSVVGIAFTVAVASGHPPFLLAAPLAALAVPLAVNATNMVDNADALASTVSAITAMVLAGLATAVAPSGEASVLAWIIVACCLGFLAYNRPPARVFMGDVGSLPLGFGLAAASIILMRAATEAAGQLPPVVLCGIAMAWAVQLGDVAMVFVTRLQRGRSPFRGGIDHTSHRLMRAGLSPTATVALLGVLSGCCGLIGLLAATRGDFGTVAVATFGVAAGITIFESLLVLRTAHDNDAVPANRRAGRPSRRSRDLAHDSNQDS